MPDINGFEVLNELPSNLNPLVVFITAFDQYAIKAFDASAFDYLLKPFDNERFYDVLNRSKKQISLVKSGKYSQNLEELIKQFTKSTETKEKQKEGISNRIMVKCEGAVTFIDVNDIISIEASDYYIKIITNIDEHIKRKSLNSIEEKLSTDQFMRIHRSTIVNVDYIKSIEKYTADEHIVVMKNGNKYRISKSGRKKLKDKFLI
jgi:two-component system LytT family response regulator